MGIAKMKRRPAVICCGVAVAVILVLAVIFVALYFTLFRPRSPKVLATAVGAEVQLKGNGGGQDLNLTVHVDVTVKNPNYAAFRYGDVLTLVRYHGDDVGQSVVPAGEIGARETQTVAAAVEVDTLKVAVSPFFLLEFAKGVLPFETATEVDGKAVVLGTFKISASSQVACEVTVHLLPTNATSECTSVIHVGR